MRILLVDDEPFYIEELERIMLEFSRKFEIPVEIADRAYDAEHALMILEQSLPDVVFTDIRMSSTDGLELSKIIQSRWPRLPVIIVSGYPSFEYAREAMRANVMDFIAKPIDLEAMDNVLRQLARTVDTSRYADQQQWLQKLILLDKKDQIDRWIKQSPTPDHKYSMALFRTTEPAYFAESWITETFHSLISERTIWICQTSARRDSLLILEDRGTQDTIQEAFEQALSSAPFPTTIVYSPDPVPIAELKATAELLLKRMTAVNEIGVTKLVKLGSGEFEGGSVQKLRISLDAKLDNPHLLQDIQMLLSECQAAHASALQVEQELTRIWFSLANQSHDSLSELIQSATCYEDIETAFGSMLKTYLLEDRYTKDPANESEILFNKITVYIQANYHEPITMNDLMDHFHLSRTTIWDIMRIYGDTTFIDYITQLRIQTAKQLMSTSPHMKIKDIATQVGYQDHHYFSRVFKTIAGVTPSEYKESKNR